VSAEPIISLSNVHKSYGQGQAATPVLRGVSFEIGRGEFVALVGESGSGKSTLLNIIGGLATADSGTVRVLGHDYGTVSDRTLSQLRNRSIGFVFQSFNLLDHMNCLENVTLPAVFARAQGGEPHAGERARERGLAALQRVGMAGLATRRPAELSGGQKQRVAIARALFHQPTLLLCDEPTGNLDSQTGQEVIEFFRELNQRDGVTLLIVTHEQRVSRTAQRVTRIVDGLMVAGEDGVRGAE
jgi:putative ABC transport system ATP-binding protein